MAAKCQGLIPASPSRRRRIAASDQITSPAANSGPKACSCKALLKSPRRLAQVARVRKQLGQGMPVRARSGQLKPGNSGLPPLNHR